MTAKLLLAAALVAGGLLCQAQTNSVKLPGPEASAPVSGTAPLKENPVDSRTLFLRNCAHCHGATARGDDGPDLHDLRLSDDWIARRIRQGKAGQMTAFAGKLTTGEISALVAYVQSLK